MRSILLILILWSASVHAQVGFFDSYFMFAHKETRYQHEGVSIATYKDGDYKKAKDLLHNGYFRANPEATLYISSLLAMTTQGKEAAFTQVTQSSLTTEKKDFMKVWLTYFADFAEDYKVLHADFEKKYSGSPELFKFTTYTQTRENAIKGTRETFRHEFYRKMNSALKDPKFSDSDKMFFRLAKLDIKGISEEYESARSLRIDTLYTLWNKQKELFSYSGLRSAIAGCETPECLEMKSWADAEKKKEEGSLAISEEDLVAKLIVQGKKNGKEIPISDLEHLINSHLATLTTPKREDIKALLSIYFMEKEINMGMLKGLFNLIPFTQKFRANNNSSLTKDQMIARMKQMSVDPEYALAFHEGAGLKFREEVDRLKAYSTDDIRVMYGLLVFSHYYVSLLQKTFGEMGINSLEPTAKQKENYREFLAFYDENPLYKPDNLYLEGMFTDLKTYADLQAFILESDALISKYRGSLPVRTMQLKVMGSRKHLVPKEMYQEFLSVFFVRLVNLYDVVQNVIFTENELTFLTDIATDAELKYNYPMYHEFYKLLNKDNLKKNRQYLLQRVKAKPHQKNLNEFLQHIDEFIGDNKR